MLVGVDQLTELGAPVAQMVDGHGLVAAEVQQIPQRVADDGGAQMAQMEPLGDVGGRKVQADRLALALLGGAVAGIGKDLLHHLHAGGAVVEEIQIAAHGLGTGKALHTLKAGGKLCGDLGRRLAQSLCQLEAGQSQIAQLGIGRLFKQRGDLALGKGQPLRGQDLRRFFHQNSFVITHLKNSLILIY